METTNEPNLINNLLNDFKAETLAVEIIESGIDPEMVLINPIGALRRPYSKDVHDIENNFDAHDKDYIVIHAAREGLYDMLPQGLFHQTLTHKHLRSDTEIAEAMKVRRAEESNARKFFLPLEAAINQLRIEMALNEQRLDKRSDYPDLVEIFSNHWEIFKYLNPRQADLFLHLLPLIHDMRADFGMIKDIMELMFETTIEIFLRTEAGKQNNNDFFSQLGYNILGVDITTGNFMLDQPEEVIVVSVGPMENFRFREFMDGGRNEIILSQLCGYLLPVEARVVTEVLLRKDYQQAVLASEFDEYNCRLGEDMVLGCEQ